MKISLRVILLLLVLSQAAYAQRKGYVIFSGKIIDIENKAPIEGASVFFSGSSDGGTTDSLGEFSITIAARSYQVIARSLGYKYKTFRLDLSKSNQMTIELERSEQLLGEVVITAEKADANVNRAMMGVEKMSSKTLKKLPTLMGEADVIRSILLLPGVSTVGEGASGFNVRGGNVDQNLVLLDGVPLFNTSHLFGFFTGFNADMVQDLSLYKGGIPSMYGGRASSVLDVRVKEGDFEKWSFQGGVGPISSRILVDGPLVKGKTSLIVGARGSVSDFYMRYFPDPNLAKSRANFYDVNFKLTHRFGRNQRISLSGYASNDGFKFAQDTLYSWNTKALSFKHNALLKGDLSHNLTAFYSDYKYGIEGQKNGLEFLWKPSIIQTSIKEELSKDLGTYGRIDAGAEISAFTNDAGSFLPNSSNSTIDKFAMPTEHTREMAAYLGHSLPIGKKISLDYGLRYASYQLIGPGDFYQYKKGVPREVNTITDTLKAGSNEVVDESASF